MKNNKIIINCLLAILSGILLFLSFPLKNFYFLAFGAVVPLLFIIESKNALTSGLFAFLAGMVGYCGIFYWIYPLLKVNTGSWLQSAVCLGGISAYVSLYLAVWAAVSAESRKCVSGIMWYVFMGAFWVILEYARTFFLTGFPWALMGYSQWKFVPFIQVAEFTGVYGVSFLLIVANVFLYKFFRMKKVVYAALFLMIPVITAAAGMAVSKKSYTLADSVTVAVIQGNIEQYKKWDTTYQDEIIKAYSGLVKLAGNDRPQVIIWPETAVPGYIPWDDYVMRWVSSVVKDSKAYNIVGSPYFDGQRDYYNATFLLSPKGEILAMHRKNHLVPFGEFVPLRKIFEPLFGVLNTLGDFKKARETKPFTAGKFVFGTTICSENFFGNLVRAFVLEGANILVNQTNDAWFLKTSAAEQHFTMNVFRAIENRRPVIVSGNTGISGVIDARGRVQQMTEIFKQTYFLAAVNPGFVRTFYTSYGDIFALICMIFAVWVALLCLRKRDPNKQR